MREAIIIHWAELQLKGSNRAFFERILFLDIQKRLTLFNLKVKKGPSKFVVHNFFPEAANGIIEILKKIPGIANIRAGVLCKADIAELKAAAVEIIGNEIATSPQSMKSCDRTISLTGAPCNDTQSQAPRNEISRSRDFVTGAAPHPMTFRIEARRSDKFFPLNSMELATQIGALIVERFGLKAQMQNPDITIFIEVDKNEAYVCSKKYEGIGGLPSGSSGRVVALISGGIDSPVASFMMIRRGCEVIAVHFQNIVAYQAGVEDKILDLCRKLSEYQPQICVYIIPFGELQRRVVMNVKAELRMLVYRRLMFQIAEEVARREGALALVTGDSLGQVASQTLENISVLHNGRTMPVLSPLIGMDKTQIMDLSRCIGIYAISILPYQDCCSMFVARHPETKARLSEIKQAEASVQVSDEEIRLIVDSAARYNIK